MSKDDEKERIYCRRWASSRGLFVERDSVFEEIDDEILVEMYTDLDEEIKRKHFGEKRLEPRRFEFDVDGKTYHGYYFMPLFRKWACDASLREYFQVRFGFDLT